MISFMCNFLKILKKTVAITLFITSSVLAMADSEKERLEQELSNLRIILRMEGLVKEERESLQRRIQNLESELHIGKLPTPVSSLVPSHYFVEEELERLRSMQDRRVEDDDAIELLEAAQREGIKKYRSLERLRRLVIVSSKDPPRCFREKIS
ncbi:MAG: hypothetical protein MRY83_13630 [Flavobacteriales bacterium]|nr:hypothetical protein [Flavobacteriales bacterium]